MVLDLANDANTMVGRHPADFSLFCVGQFDDASGQLLPANNREHISDCLPLVRAATQRDFFSSAANGADK